MVRGVQRRVGGSVAAGLAGLVAAGCLGAAPARAETAGSLLACVQKRYGALVDLSASFVQESRVATLGRTRTRTGRMHFGAAGRMRWEYDPPEPQLIVADGKQLWFHRPEQRQVIVQRLDAAFARQTPLLFLFGKGDFAAEFTWREELAAAAPDGAVPVVLTPRKESPELVRLTLEVVAGECRLAGTTIEDAFGNRTRLAFSAERLNPGLAAALFRFEPPAGTDIVRP